MFYERSDSLIGICKDVGTNSSRTMTLDLTEYDKKDDNKHGKKRGRRAVSEGGPSKKKPALEMSPTPTVTTQWVVLLRSLLNEWTMSKCIQFWL